MMPYCAKCGNEVGNEDQFCSNCGNLRRETVKPSSIRKRGKVYLIIPVAIIVVLMVVFYDISGIREEAPQNDTEVTQPDMTAEDDSAHVEETAERDAQLIEGASIESLAEEPNRVSELPETKIVIESIEGSDIEYEYTLHVSDLGYGIYLDNNRFQVISQNSRDRIVDKGMTWDDNYDEYIEIWLEEGDFMELSDKIYTTIRNEFESHYKQPTSYSFGGITVSGFTLETFEADLYHIVDNFSGGSFVIRNKFCMEHCGSLKISYMLDEFFIVQ